MVTHLVIRNKNLKSYSCVWEHQQVNFVVLIYYIYEIFNTVVQIYNETMDKRIKMEKSDLVFYRLVAKILKLLYIMVELPKVEVR